MTTTTNNTPAIPELVILSGKGGTGKTTVTAALATLADRPCLADADVDAPDLHLLLSPDIQATHPFSGGERARIDPDRCLACGACERACRFDAITADGPRAPRRIIDSACEGCAACTVVCPDGAVTMEPAINGNWFQSETRFGPMVHARLEPGEENSGKLVALVRQQARTLATQHHCTLLLTDGAPGVGCPVIASLGGASLILAVCEPTPSGLHDLQRLLDLAHHFRIPAAVAINKHDLHPHLTDRILLACQHRNVPVLGRLRFDPDAIDAQINRQTIVEHLHSPLADDLRTLWNNLRPRLLDAPTASRRETA